MRRKAFFYKFFVTLFFLASAWFLVSAMPGVPPASDPEGADAAYVAKSGLAPSVSAPAVAASSTAAPAAAKRAVAADVIDSIVFSTVSGSHPFAAIVVDTPELRERGLGGRAGLKDNQAMLFVFESVGRHSFWMKDMLFSIDMVWLDAGKRVIHVERNVSPDTFPKAFGPDADAKYVIELSAGAAEKMSLRTGDSVSF